MRTNPPVRLPLFCVVVASVDSPDDKAITAARISRDEAEAAAERLNELECCFVARVRKMRWRLVAVA